MLLRSTGASSSPSSAGFSSSSWKARFNARIAAKVKVTHKMLGARSTLETAVGSRPKLNTTSTRTTNTAAERIAVRDRNSTRRSLAATVQLWRRSSGNRIAILLAHLRRPATRPRREMHEPARAHERDVGREARALLDIVGHQHRRPSGGGMLCQQPAQRFRRDAIEPREGLVEQQHRGIVHERTGDRDTLHQATRQRAHRTIRVLLESQPAQEVGRRLHAVERRPEAQVLADGERGVELRLVTNPSDRPASSGDLRTPALRLYQSGEDLEQCCLAGAVGTEHGKRLTGLYGEGNLVERLDRSETVPQSFSPQHRWRRRARSIRRV